MGFLFTFGSQNGPSPWTSMKQNCIEIAALSSFFRTFFANESPFQFLTHTFLSCSDGSEVSRDPRNGEVSAELVLKGNVPVLASFSSPWPLGKTKDMTMCYLFWNIISISFRWVLLNQFLIFISVFYFFFHIVSDGNHLRCRMPRWEHR